MPAPTEEDWKAFDAAHVALEPHEKLVKTKNFNKYSKGACPYKTDYSFVNINGHIVAMDIGSDALLGKGGFGFVKKAYMRDGSSWAVKIEYIDVWRESYQSTMIKNENKVLADLALGKGYSYRDRAAHLPKSKRYKFYTLMKYLGISLFEDLWCYGSKLSDAERLKLAVDLSVLLAKLHRGDLSSTKTPWAHLDFKPTNVTIDKKNKLHLIDFAFSEKDIYKRATDLRGSAIYIPHDWSSISKEMRDVFGLLRTLYLPANFYNGLGKLDHSEPSEPQVLTAALIARIKLTDELLTDATRQKKGLEYRTAGEIAALLILASLDLQDLYKMVNKLSAYKVIDCYEARKENVKGALRALFNPDGRLCVSDSSTHQVLKELTEVETLHDRLCPPAPEASSFESEPEKKLSDAPKKDFKMDPDKLAAESTTAQVFFKPASGMKAGVTTPYEIYEESDGRLIALV